MSAAHSPIATEARVVAPPAAASPLPRTLAFPRGLPGFPRARCFRLEPLAGSSFALLRSEEDPDLAFVVLAALPDATGIAAEEIDRACTEFAMAREHVALLFVVRLERAGSGCRAFVNLRAPIFVDRASAQAIQRVLSDPRYPLRQPLPRSAA